MPVVAIAMLVAGGLTAYSQYQQGQIAKQTSEFQAKTQENEAITADLENRQNLERLRQMNREQLASRRAEIAVSGVAGFTGSPLAQLGEEAGRLELRAQDEARASGLGLQRSFTEAMLTRAQGKTAAQAGKLQAASTLLSSVGKAYGAYKGT